MYCDCTYAEENNCKHMVAILYYLENDGQIKSKKNNEKSTSYFSFGEKKNLNNYDKQVFEYYQEILNSIIEIAKQEDIKEVEIIDQRYFKESNSANMMIEDYMSVLQFYDNIGDNKNKQKYQELYDKWKSKRDTIKF